jgi:hypothetical protein
MYIGNQECRNNLGSRCKIGYNLYIIKCDLWNHLLNYTLMGESQFAFLWARISYIAISS